MTKASLSLNHKIPGSDNFKWHEFLWLPEWRIYAFPTDDVYFNLIKTAIKMDKIRSYLDHKPIIVTSGWRPPLYNEEIGGAAMSAHKKGLACDFKHTSLKASRVREILEPVLEDFDIRMENHNGSWVHIDLLEPVNNRFFIP